MTDIIENAILQHIDVPKYEAVIKAEAKDKAKLLSMAKGASK